ncbi:MAG: outer membrane lipoprotein-sorting protein [Desulfobacterales bacterium]|nr:outer membrane lipoprotein-sorting protein [Desulfobacterales bacterium]
MKIALIKGIMIWAIIAGAALQYPPTVCADDAAEIIRKNFDYMREKASVSTVEMRVVRPDWQRTTTLNAWTRGDKDSLFIVLGPAKDKGNGTLKKGREMWIFNPKVNRTIKLPPSMMSQSWMGSDFSNNDLAKSDSIIVDYDHTLDGTEVHDGKTVYRIRSMPKPGAPVVWGMLTLKIREDAIPLEEVFCDEEMAPVKVLTFSDIGPLGGKLYPRVMTMKTTDAPGEYTTVTYLSLEFLEALPDRLFTLSALKNPRN